MELRIVWAEIQKEWHCRAKRCSMNYGINVKRLTEEENRKTEQDKESEKRSQTIDLTDDDLY